MTATVKELARLIGRTGEIELEGFTIAVRVLDAKIMIGGVQLEVAPIHGGGTRWIEQRRVQFTEALNNVRTIGA